jgi:WhiB family redox-sensing transcriptional regulator
MSVPTNDGVFLWQDEAVCRGKDTSIFFDNDREAKRICSACPVKSECLEYALLYNPSGVWGGTTAKERAKVSKISVKMLRDDYMESGLYNFKLKA